MAGEIQHSPVGASSAYRWMNCAGSVALIARVPKQLSTKYAAEGTAAHKLAERCLNAGFEPEELVSRFVEVDGERFEITPEMAEAVQPYVDTCRMLADLAGEGNYWVERRFSLDGYGEKLWGTNDFSAFLRDVGQLHVVDLKYGADVAVHVTDNPQLKYYGLGALIDVGPGVKEVVLTVVQPRAGGEPVRSWKLDAADLLEFGADLAEAAEKTRAPDAPLASGSWCRFCPARGICPALEADVAKMAGAEFEDLTKGAELPAPELMPDLGARLALADRVSAWISAVRALAYEQAKAGAPPEGWKLVEKKGRRSWKDGNLAMRQAMRAFNLPEDRLFDLKPIGITKFEKVVGRGKARDFLDIHTKRGSNVALVPTSDERPAVTNLAEVEFEDITAEADE